MPGAEPFGLALTGAGILANNIGQAQGARGLAGAKRAQLAEQQKFQDESNADTGAAIANANPALAAEQSTASFAQPGQAFVEGLKDYHPLGLSMPAQQALSSSMGATVADAEEANQRLARINGRGQAQRGIGLSMQALQDKQGTLRDKFKRRAALYDIQDQVAAGHGMALREGGNIAKAVGSGMAGGGMGGPDDPKSDPNYFA